MRALLDSDDFSSFIRHPLFLGDRGAAPQVHSLCDADGRLLVTDILRFESLSRDYERVAAELGFSTGLKPVNTSRAAPRVEIVKEDIEYLHGIYRRDYEALMP